ncbi:hypothetical protein [Legionella sp. W05-934-2]|jgi:hypothetical protein|uniref:hypothetical protein n=1 Tax=Legionella sp. W05-934-2 TaxID=1198649 RepID=UPI0034630007
MSILIITEPDDIHAVLISLALEKKGHDSHLLFTADMPSRQKNSIYFNNEQSTWRTSIGQTEDIIWDDKTIQSVWWRRPRKPAIPSTIHPEDKAFIERENAIYHLSIPYMINPDAWWVNPIASTYKTRSKITQLKIAQQCGFKLPETLVSNSPEHIKQFITQTIYATTIYKPFAPHYWHEPEGIRLLYTDKISLPDLPSDAMLQMSPGIYQRYVEKKFELRVTCFGSHISAVKIDSQSHALGITDWRKIPGHELSIQPFELPPAIIHKIIRFMKKAGVVFGCFDFIVTPEHDIVFLELNEQGQFLWVEELLPELCYMDMFAEFIINQRFDFKWQPTKQTLSTLNFDKKAEEIVANNIKNHVYLNQIKRVA